MTITYKTTIKDINKYYQDILINDVEINRLKKIIEDGTYIAPLHSLQSDTHIIITEENMTLEMHPYSKIHSYECEQYTSECSIAKHELQLLKIKFATMRKNSLKNKKKSKTTTHGGFKTNKKATLYFIKIGENTLGYGISNNFKTRLTQHKRTFNENGVEFEVLHTVAFEDGQVCLDAERLLKNNLPHNGCTLKGFKTEATAMSYFNEAKRLVATFG